MLFLYAKNRIRARALQRDKIRPPVSTVHTILETKTPISTTLRCIMDVPLEQNQNRQIFSKNSTFQQQDESMFTVSLPQFPRIGIGISQIKTKNIENRSKRPSKKDIR